MARVTGILLGLALLCGAASLQAQQRPWYDQWFWGISDGCRQVCDLRETPEEMAYRRAP